MEIKSTEKLDNILHNVKSISQLGDYLGNIEDPEFSSIGDYLTYILEEKKLDKSEVIKNSDIQRNYGYQIFSNTRLPGRDKIIALSLSMHMNLPETTRALSIAKEGRLYSKDVRDSIIIYAINQGLNVLDTNDLLFEFQQDLLS